MHHAQRVDAGRACGGIRLGIAACSGRDQDGGMIDRVMVGWSVEY